LEAAIPKSQKQFPPSVVFRQSSRPAAGQSGYGLAFSKTSKIKQKTEGRRRMTEDRKVSLRLALRTGKNPFDKLRAGEDREKILLEN